MSLRVAMKADYISKKLKTKNNNKKQPQTTKWGIYPSTVQQVLPMHLRDTLILG